MKKISSSEENIMVHIDKKTVESLELHLVLQHVSAYCITQLGKDKALSIVPFTDVSAISPELHRVKEFTASFLVSPPFRFVRLKTFPPLPRYNLAFGRCNIVKILHK